MQAIIQAIEAHTLHAEIAVVISDREQAGILEKARTHHITAVYVSTKHNGKRLERAAYDTLVDRLLQEHNVDLVLMIGYMRIVSPLFCNRWDGAIVNVHPSLLPEFAGGMDENVHKSVLASGRTETGCTVHLVTEAVDGGPILLQKRCAVYREDTPETVKQRVQQLEGEALIEVIEQFFQAYQV